MSPSETAVWVRRPASGDSNCSILKQLQRDFLRKQYVAQGKMP
jgi:hypothetical protein